MADFLLIHGSCHGAWCWEKVIPLLETMGHRTRAIDLPGHGGDATPVAEVTLDRYAKAIASTCSPNTTLVGHSMGGYAITAASCLVPENISQLIYLCAYVPLDGKTLAEMRMLAPRQPLLPALRKSSDGLSFTIDPEMAGDIFYHDCEDAVAQAAIERLCPQAVAPNNATVTPTSPLKKLPRHYIRCLDDHTIPPEFQVTMTEDWPSCDVQEMYCGHSPFYADPVGLAARLDAATKG